MTFSLHPATVLEATQRFITDHARGQQDQAYPHTCLLNTELKTLLGCPYASTRRDGTDILVRPEASPGLLVGARLCLPLLLDEIVDHRGHADDVASLLAGVELSGWRETMLTTEETAYTLAATLVYFLESYDPFSAVLHLDVIPRACTILNEWLAPAARFSLGELPTPRELCCLFFGDAWCDFVLANVKGRDVVSFVRQARPPFLLGLCPTQDASTQPRSPLPDLGVSP